MVQKNLQDLVAHYLPGNCTDDAIQRLVSYSMRILSARMQTSVTQHGSADSDHIKQLLIKKGKPSLIDANVKNSATESQGGSKHGRRGRSQGTHGSASDSWRGNSTVRASLHTTAD